jgi:anti-sigma factor RsiW
MLLDYSAGKLEPAARMALEEHLADCEKCRDAVQAHSAVWNALDAWEPEQMSLDFNRRLWQRIEDTPAQPWYARLASWKPMLPSAVTALVLVAAAFVTQSAFERPFGVLEHEVSIQGAAAESDVSVTEVDQAVTTLDDLQLLQQLDSATVPESASRI